MPTLALAVLMAVVAKPPFPRFPGDPAPKAYEDQQLEKLRGQQDAELQRRQLVHERNQLDKLLTELRKYQKASDAKAVELSNRIAATLAKIEVLADDMVDENRNHLARIEQSRKEDIAQVMAAVAEAARQVDDDPNPSKQEGQAAFDRQLAAIQIAVSKAINAAFSERDRQAARQRDEAAAVVPKPKNTTPAPKKQVTMPPPAPQTPVLLMVGIPLIVLIGVGGIVTALVYARNAQQKETV